MVEVPESKELVFEETNIFECTGTFQGALPFINWIHNGLKIHKHIEENPLCNSMYQVRMCFVSLGIFISSTEGVLKLHFPDIVLDGGTYIAALAIP